MSAEDTYKTPTLVDLPSTKEQKPSLPPPTYIANYRIESVLNKGGMSLLYLGIHPETGQPITIKVLSSKFVNHLEMVERFMKEAEIIEITNHPNIVKIYGYGKWEGGVYIAMEFIHGISLRELILQQALPLRRALEIVLQIAHALTHLHAHGIIHRDLKPENILLTAQGGIKVVDFGIAQLHSEEKNEKGEKIFIGTPAYMSPEQRENPNKASFSTDIYSLALITYELVLGQLSYGTVHLALMPKGLQKILAKALKPNPADRYEDIVDFIKDISLYLTSDELKKEMRGSDYLGEVTESLKMAQTLVIPSAPPTWPRIELAIRSNATSAISSLYYDFFQPREGTYVVVMGEAFRGGVEGLISIALLRGMVRSLASEVTQGRDLIIKVNKQIIEDRSDISFSFSYLTLVPGEERFSYISCGYSPLWLVPLGIETPRRILAENVAIGILEDMDVIEVNANWNVGDHILLHAFQAGLAKSSEEVVRDEEALAKAMTENLTLPLQTQIDAIFRKAAPSQPRALSERGVTLIGIRRQI